MFPVRRLTTIGIIALLLFLVARFPASTAFAWFAPASVGGFGISGTVWNGSARLISAPGLQFRDTEWNLAAWRVFLGQAGGQLKTRWGGGFIEATGSIGLGGTVRLNNVRGGFDITQLSGALGTPDISGVASVNFSELVLRDNWPVSIVGSGELTSLSSSLMGTGAAQLIGDIAFEFNTDTETDSETVTGQLTDIGGPLELGGTLVLTPPGNYEIKTRLRARDDAPQTLRQNLNFLGAPEPDGRHIFQLAGSI